MSSAHTEHRRSLRIDVDLPVLRKVQQRFEPGKALNLSTSGLALQTGLPLVPRQLENLVLSTPDGALEVMVQAEVVRVARGGEQSAYLGGLRFAALDTTATSRIEALMLLAMGMKHGARDGPRVEVHANAFWSGK